MFMQKGGGGGPSLSPAGAAAGGVPDGPVGIEAVDRLVEVELPGVDLERRVRSQVGLGDDRSAAVPAVLLQVVGNARNDVVPVAPEVTLVVRVRVDGIAAVGRRHEL